MSVCRRKGTGCRERFIGAGVLLGVLFSSECGGRRGGPGTCEVSTGNTCVMSRPGI